MLISSVSLRVLTRNKAFGTALAFGITMLPRLLVLSLSFIAKKALENLRIFFRFRKYSTHCILQAQCVFIVFYCIISKLGLHEHNYGTDHTINVYVF